VKLRKLMPWLFEAEVKREAFLLKELQLIGKDKDEFRSRYFAELRNIEKAKEAHNVEISKLYEVKALEIRDYEARLSGTELHCNIQKETIEKQNLLIATLQDLIK